MYHLIENNYSKFHIMGVFDWAFCAARFLEALFVEKKSIENCFTLRILQQEKPSASRSLAGSTFSIERVLHAKYREAQKFQSSRMRH